MFLVDFRTMFESTADELHHVAPCFKSGETILGFSDEDI
jgi:hypothetical protein